MADRLGQMVLRGKELLAYVSHELRSPLARINVSEQLLRDRLERGEHEGLGRYLESIREEVGQMDSLLERILLLSRLDLQREPPKRELIDLTEMLEQLGQRWEPILGHRGLDLQLALAPGAAVRGDGDALSTAFSNLLDNAAKYTPAGGSVKVSLDPGPGNTWSLQVFNTTEPLPEDELEAIFRPFHRLHDRHDDRQGGSGLGLALTREIVKAHRGQVTARNTPPGFTILVSLPGERPQAEAQLA
jgi:two-component system sensor histidine kinase CpxA